MYRKEIVRVAIALFALCILFSVPVRAQQMKEAVAMYNEAATNYKQNPKKALADFTKCVELCDKLGTDEAKELKEKAEKNIPRTHLEHAKQLFRGGDVPASIKAMELARETAEKIKDQSTVRTVNRTIPQIYYAEGVKLQKDSQYESAIEHFQKASKANEKFLEPVLATAICQDSLKQYNEMLATLEEGIAQAKKVNNIQRELDMRVMALNYLKAKGQRFQDKKQIDSAIVTLDRAVQLDDKDGQVYLALALCYKSKADFEKTVSNCDLALEHAGGTMDKTQVYFLKAQALQAKGDKDGACEAYGHAAQGAFKEASEHQMKEVLKCK